MKSSNNQIKIHCTNAVLYKIVINQCIEIKKFDVPGMAKESPILPLQVFVM